MECLKCSVMLEEMEDSLSLLNLQNEMKAKTNLTKPDIVFAPINELHFMLNLANNQDLIASAKISNVYSTCT